jgi:hypothetical protein
MVIAFNSESSTFLILVKQSTVPEAHAGQDMWIYAENESNHTLRSFLISRVIRVIKSSSA